VYLIGLILFIDTAVFDPLLLLVVHPARLQYNNVLFRIGSVSFVTFLFIVHIPLRSLNICGPTSSSLLFKLL